MYMDDKTKTQVGGGTGTGAAPGVPSRFDTLLEKGADVAVSGALIVAALETVQRDPVNATFFFIMGGANALRHVFRI